VAAVLTENLVNALDTNIIVRIIIGDDQRQATAARAVLENGRAFLATTVVLESEWVLRSVYRLGRDVTAAALAKFCGLEQVELESADLVRDALLCYVDGMDLADALHLLSAEAAGARRFCTFDVGFAKSATRRAGGIKVERL
jgi:predicted nucleic-acid-binding protein